MKAILDLCRELPDAAAEAELRARAGELGQDVAMLVMGWTPVSAVFWVATIERGKNAVLTVISGMSRVCFG